MSILFQDGFETGNLAHTEGGYQWGESNGAAPTVVNTHARTGSHSLQFEFGPNAPGDDSWSEQRFILGTNLSEVYIRWYQYFPTGTEGLGSAKWVHRDDVSSDNNKFVRVWDIDYVSYKIKIGASFWPAAYPDSVVGMDKGVNGSGVAPQTPTPVMVNDAIRGQWSYVEWQFKIDTGAGNGIMRLWVVDDVTPLISMTGVSNFPSGGTGNYFKNGYIMGWANSGFLNKTYTWVDDVVIADARIGPSTVSGGITPARASGTLASSSARMNFGIFTRTP